MQREGGGSWQEKTRDIFQCPVACPGTELWAAEHFRIRTSGRAAHQGGLGDEAGLSTDSSIWQFGIRGTWSEPPVRWGSRAVESRGKRQPGLSGIAQLFPDALWWYITLSNDLWWKKEKGYPAPTAFTPPGLYQGGCRWSHRLYCCCLQAS